MFPWLTLALVGNSTSSILFGTGVTCPIYRYHPATVAQAFASLAILNPGRVFLGLGTGERLNEQAATDTFGNYRERHDRLIEAIVLIRQLWSGERISFTGHYFRTDELKLYDTPAMPPPIFVAASGPQSATLAGRYGDGWIAQARDINDAKLLAAFAAGAQAAGRDPTTLGKRAELFAVVGDDKAAARAADLWRFTAGAVDQPNPVEIQRAAESNPIEKVLANWAVGTDPGVHIGAVQAVLDAGAVPFLHFPQDDPITAIDFYRTYDGLALSTMPVRRRAGERLPTVWDFETDPQYQSKLDWVEKFMAEELEPLDLVALDPYDKKNADTMAILRPLQRQVKDQGLWAAHLRPELGGQGFGQVKLALLNEIIGRSRWAPSAFGCQAPDSGNAEILALFGTDEQKARYLRPLLDGEITSCYSMTEPQGGSDPGLFVTAATRDAAGNGDWIINGEKWFSTNAKHASFFIVMAVTKPEARTYEKMSLFIVPADTPGIEIVRNVGVGAESTRHASHGYIRYHDVRVPADHVLGGEGQAFMIAQTRLGGGRIHHAMRTIALARRAFDMMCERALSRQTRHGRLADLQMTQEKIADSWIQIEQFRLLVLRTAWLIDKHHDYQKVRRDIAAVKVAMPQVLHDVVQRAMHLHGALGVSDEMPFVKMMLAAESLGIADGATELHKMTVARRTLREYQPVTTLFPSQHIPTRRAHAEAWLAQRLEHAIAEF